MTPTHPPTWAKITVHEHQAYSAAQETSHTTWHECTFGINILYKPVFHSLQFGTSCRMKFNGNLIGGGSTESRLQEKLVPKNATTDVRLAERTERLEPYINPDKDCLRNSETREVDNVKLWYFP